MATVWIFEVGVGTGTERTLQGTFDKQYKAFAAVRRWTAIKHKYKRLPWEFDRYPDGPAYCLYSGDPEDPRAIVPNPYRLYVTPREI